MISASRVRLRVLCCYGGIFGILMQVEQYVLQLNDSTSQGSVCRSGPRQNSFPISVERYLTAS